MSKQILDKIKKLLDNNQVQYKVMEHAPVRTSEEAARVRGISLKSGAKSMIVRSEGKFYDFILSAEKRLDWNKIKVILNSKSAGLATPEEVLKITDCEIGSVPPFGNVVNLKVYCDPSLLDSKTIDFNAGLLTVSINMELKDWLDVVKPEVVGFSKI